MSRATVPLRRGLPPAAAGIPVPADKRFRRSDVRPARPRSWRAIRRRAAWYGGGALVALTLAVWIGGLLLNAPVLQIDRIQVSGQSRLSQAELDQRLEGLVGANILRANLEQYRLQLAASPWVESAELWRVLPSTVQVRIVERSPLAIARLRGHLYLIDAAGVVIDSYGPQHAEFDLPIVDGAMTAAPDGPVADERRIDLVRRLFSELSGRSDLFQRVSQVDVSDARNAVLLLDGEAAELRLGDRNFLARLLRYVETAPALRDRTEVREYWDLRFDNRIWVK